LVDLTKDEKQALKTVLKLTLLPEDERFNAFIRCYISKQGLSATDILQKLKDKKLIEYSRIVQSDITILQVTYAGHTFREHQLIDLKNFFLRSIATPIIVAIITSVLTVLAIKLLQWLLSR